MVDPDNLERIEPATSALRIDRSLVTEALNRHRASPHVSFIEHVRESQTALANSLKSRKAVYLDTKYWIILRNAAMGDVARVDGGRLLSRLRALASTGFAFCPISESSFAELFKQRDPITRRATAAMIDELSMGVTLVPFYDRIPLELQYLIERGMNYEQARHPSGLVWLKLPYALGLVHQTETPFDAATELMLQKGFFDYLWTVSMTDIVDQIGEARQHDDMFDALAKRLSGEVDEHADELKSFGQAYEAEAAAADIYATTAAHMSSDLVERVEGRRMERNGPPWEGLIAFWANFLPKALQTDRGRELLPTLHIHTSLHASVRWNKGQRFKANHFYDFHHAQAALAYCDVFLTEQPLKAMVTANHVALDKLYGCDVAATIEEALMALEAL